MRDPTMGNRHQELKDIREEKIPKLEKKGFSLQNGSTTNPKEM